MPDEGGVPSREERIARAKGIAKEFLSAQTNGAGEVVVSGSSEPAPAPAVAPAVPAAPAAAAPAIAPGMPTAAAPAVPMPTPQAMAAAIAMSPPAAADPAPAPAPASAPAVPPAPAPDGDDDPLGQLHAKNRVGEQHRRRAKELQRENEELRHQIRMAFADPVGAFARWHKDFDLPGDLDINTIATPLYLETVPEDSGYAGQRDQHRTSARLARLEAEREREQTLAATEAEEQRKMAEQHQLLVYKGGIMKNIAANPAKTPNLSAYIEKEGLANVVQELYGVEVARWAEGHTPRTPEQLAEWSEQVLAAVGSNTANGSAPTTQPNQAAQHAANGSTALPPTVSNAGGALQTDRTGEPEKLTPDERRRRATQIWKEGIGG